MLQQHSCIACTMPCLAILVNVQALLYREEVEVKELDLTAEAKLDMPVPLQQASMLAASKIRNLLNAVLLQAKVA